MKKTLIIAFFLILPVSVSLALSSVVSKPPNKLNKPIKPKSSISPRTLPQAGTDQNRALQADLDVALFSSEEFFSSQSYLPRPYLQARENLDQLISKYPKDPRLLRYAANLDEKLGNFDKATEEMRTYVSMRKESPNALRRLAAFYHQRAMYMDEVKTLQKFSMVAFPFELNEIYSQIQKLVKENNIQGFDIPGFYKQSISANPTNFALVQKYIEFLTSAQNYSECLQELNKLQQKYPNELRYFLKEKANIYELQHDRLGAENSYNTIFDPLWPRPIVSDYYDLLRKLGRYRIYRRELQNKFLKNQNKEFNTAVRLFNIYAYEANFPQAIQVITELENHRGTKTTGWSTKELEIISALCLQIGNYDQASRFLYSLYLNQGLKNGSKEREQLLGKLANILLDAQSNYTSIGAQDISIYADIATTDQNIGFINSILSLILAGNNPSIAFKSTEHSGINYFNRALAYKFYTALKSEFPNSISLSPIHLQLLDAFTSMGEFELVVKLGDEFLQQFPQANNYEEIMLKVADAEVQLKRRGSERTRLLALLDRKGSQRLPEKFLMPVSQKRWKYTTSNSSSIDLQTTSNEEETNSEGNNTPQNYEIYDPTNTEESNNNNDYLDYPTDYLGNSIKPAENTTYQQILERVISSFAAEEKPQETLKFLFGEIKKYPQEEGLYERLLSWLGQTSIVDEQLKAYTQAVRHFNSNTWYHRLARYFVRNEKQEEFEKYSKELTEILDEGDLAEYLQQFVSSTDLSVDNNDNKLYVELYKFAHKRFPTNPFFVKGLLKYYHENKNWKEWEQLSCAYYFADYQVAGEYLKYLSQNNQLRNYNNTAKSRTTQSLAYKRFAADSAMWLSHPEEAITTYSELIEQYPGEPQYAEQFAKLARSLGSQDIKLHNKAANTWIQLAKVYPSDHTYPTQAGEIYAELGDFKKAQQQWDSIISLEKGNSETYLEVASIYWDYFLYEDAVRVLTTLRKISGTPTAYAYQMGAINEGQNKIDSALAEYISALSITNDDRDKSLKRLKQLSSKKDYNLRIAKIFSANQTQLGHSRDTQLVLGYSQHLREIGQTDQSLALLKNEASIHTDFDFLEAIRDEFHKNHQVLEESKTIQRMIEIARDEHDTIKYQLQLATFYEQQARVDEAVNIIDKLITNFPTNLGVVQEATNFYWRVGLLDKSINLYQRTSGQAIGQYKRQFTLQLAKRQMDAGKNEDAAKTLREWYTANPLDIETFSLLTKALGELGRHEELVTLYREGLKNIAQAQLNSDERKEKTAKLRLGLIETFTNLKLYTEAIDQHIEIINRDPENSEVLNSAINYAVKYQQMNRLVAYYAELAKKADRNYKWNMVLGALYTYNGNITNAIDQYKTAVLNEPQRLDFRFTLANLYQRVGRFEEAVTTLKRASELDANNPQWLVTLAKLYLQQTDGTIKAVATLREAITKRKQTPASTYFSYGKLLLDNGLINEASTFYEDGIKQVKTNLYRESLTTNDITNWLSIIGRIKSPAEAFLKLEALQIFFEQEAQKPNNANAAIPRAFAESTKSTLVDFGTFVRNYASPQQLSELGNLLRPRIETAVKNTTIQELSSIASGLGLTQLEELTRIKAKDIAFSARSKPTDTQFSKQLEELLYFYRRHKKFDTALQLLTAEEKRERFQGTFNYLRARANIYREAGDISNEITVLGQLYRTQTGDISKTEDPDIGKYLNLLYGQGKRDELNALTRIHSPFQLQLVNFLIKHQEKDLAIQAISNAGLTEAWAMSNAAQLELYFHNKSPEVEKLFKQVLGLRSIGQTIGAAPNKQKELIGNDWYQMASNYGIWMSLDPKQIINASDYLISSIESTPNSATEHINLADFYRRTKQFDKAKAHIQLANEIEPREPKTFVVEGAILFDTGKTKDAIVTWNKILTSRKPNNETYLLYIETLDRYGMVAESFPAIEKRLTTLISKPETDIEDCGELLRSIKTIADKRPQIKQNLQDLIIRVMRSTPEDIRLGMLVLNEETLKGASLNPFYELLHEQITNSILAAYSNGDYKAEETHYEQTLPQSLFNLEKIWIDKLILDKAYLEAEKTISDILKTRQLLFRQLNDTDTGEYEEQETYSVEPEWLVMAQAVLELRTNRIDKAIQRLEQFIELKKELNPSSDIYLHPYTLLVNEGQQSKADLILAQHYQRENYWTAKTGLAEIEFRQNQPDKALFRLKELVNNSNDTEVITAAAEVAQRYNQQATAIEYRTKVTQLAQFNIQNKIELARLHGVSGVKEKSVTILTELIDSNNVTNQQRAVAIELLGDILRRDRSLTGQVISNYQNKTDLYSQIVLALAQEAAGNIDQAKNIFEKTSTIPYAVLANIERAQFAKRQNQLDVAINAFETALKNDPNCTISTGLKFADAQPIQALTKLYLQANKPLLALQLIRKPISTTETENNSTLISFNYLERQKDKLLASDYKTLEEEGKIRELETYRQSYMSLADAATQLGDINTAIEFVRAARQIVNNQQSIAIADTKLNDLIAKQNKANESYLTISTNIASNSMLESFTIE